MENVNHTRLPHWHLHLHFVISQEELEFFALNVEETTELEAVALESPCVVKEKFTLRVFVHC